jgi:hypothetical protein
VNANTSVIHIGSIEQEYLSIAVLGRRYPHADNAWDANWLEVSLTVQIARYSGEFQGRVKALLSPSELLSFHNQLTELYQALHGTATLSSLEGWLEVKCVGDGRGHIDIACRLTNEPGIGDTMSFRLDIDQTYLPAILSSLDEVLAAYPSIQDV